MAAAATFSSRKLRRLVPGMGTMSSPCASSQASATCPGFTPFRSAMAVTIRAADMFRS